uniref:Uncharacterized protein n=1 Tax=Lotharella oceanica TaxID=641309 RepID=A0A7S2TII8_9EUKA
MVLIPVYAYSIAYFWNSAFTLGLYHFVLPKEEEDSEDVELDRQSLPKNMQVVNDEEMCAFADENQTIGHPVVRYLHLSTDFHLPHSPLPKDSTRRQRQISMMTAH